MAKFSGAVLTEVQNFLANRRAHYVKLLELVEQNLVVLKDAPDYSGAVYRIYSRKDKQSGGDPLKKEWKIAEKIARWREDGRHVAIETLHDIIGATVVVYFPSDVERVVDDLLKGNYMKDIRIFDRDVKEEEGYYAIHLKAACDSIPYLGGLLCEVQVKTVLSDAWGAKTHDLTYKSPFPISSDLKSNMNIIGDYLQVIEKQSEIIKKIIEKEWEVDQARKEMAVSEFLLAMSKDSRTDVDSEAAELAKKMADDAGKMWDPRQDSQAFLVHFDAWKGFRTKHGDNRSTCRLVVLLACLRASDDFNNFALNVLESWRNSLATESDQLSALSFRGNARFALGDFQTAVEDAEAALSMGEAILEKAKADANAAPEVAENIKARLDVLRLNIVYFLGEDYHHRSHRMTSSEKQMIEARARTLVEPLIPLILDGTSTLDPTRRSKFLDTVGHYQIIFGESNDEVEIGLKNCEHALALAKEDAVNLRVAEAFYRLHQRRALRRLLR